MLIVDCYADEARRSLRRRAKVPAAMTSATLAGAFAADLADVRLHNEAFDGPLEDERTLAFPDLLVLSGLQASFDRFLHLTAYARTRNPSVVVVAGGPSVRALPRFSRQFFDYTCLGDVEELAEIAGEVLGSAYVSRHYREHGWLLPRYDLARWMGRIGYPEASRNCYHNCSFCSLTAEGAAYRSYEPEVLRAMLEAMGPRWMLHFLDNNFATPQTESLLPRLDLLAEYHARGYFRGWGAEVSEDFFLDEGQVHRARAAGCVVLFTGVESFDNATLQRWRKRQNTRIPQLQIIRRTLEAGVVCYYGLVLDLSRRSVADLRDEILMSVSHPDVTLPTFSTLAIPLLGTPFFHECVAEGRFLPNVRLRDLDGSTIALHPHSPLGDAIGFVRDLQNHRWLRREVAVHAAAFYRRYRGTFSLELMGLAQICGALLCTPTWSTMGADPWSVGRGLLGRDRRTFVAGTGPLDPYYRPAFPVAARFERYFAPTRLTDERGQVTEELAPDLLTAGAWRQRRQRRSAAE